MSTDFISFNYQAKTDTVESLLRRTTLENRGANGLWQPARPTCGRRSTTCAVLSSTTTNHPEVSACFFPHTDSSLFWHTIFLIACVCVTDSRKGVQTMRMMMMIAFITFKSSLVPLLEGLWSSNSWEFELSGFRRNRTDDLGIDSPSLWPTEPRLHVRSEYKCKLPRTSNFCLPASTHLVSDWLVL